MEWHVPRVGTGAPGREKVDFGALAVGKAVCATATAVCAGELDLLIYFSHDIELEYCLRKTSSSKKMSNLMPLVTLIMPSTRILSTISM